MEMEDQIGVAILSRNCICPQFLHEEHLIRKLRCHSWVITKCFILKNIKCWCLVNKLIVKVTFLHCCRFRNTFVGIENIMYLHLGYVTQWTRQLYTSIIIIIIIIYYASIQGSELVNKLLTVIQEHQINNYKQTRLTMNSIKYRLLVKWICKCKRRG